MPFFSVSGGKAAKKLSPWGKWLGVAESKGVKHCSKCNNLTHTTKGTSCRKGTLATVSCQLSAISSQQFAFGE